jgi:hypothetical protein
LIQAANSPKLTERESQRLLMAKKRAQQRDEQIPPIENVARRINALNDPESFVRTYFSDIFFEKFTKDRRDMFDTIINAGMYGGDQAIAGPRGEGKSTIAIYASLYLMLKGLCGFPIVIGKSQTKSQTELKALKEKLQQNELFIADFPEIGVPFNRIGGWSSRARMQTVGGKKTNIEIAADHIIFPTISVDQLGNDWPAECPPTSCGQIMASIGIDGPIRGTKFRDRRPKIAIIDDIEDRGSANSDVITAKNDEIIEQDIAGLGAGAERVSRVMICTIQNRRCIAYRYTDTKQKPSWNGRRYRKLLKAPDRMDLVNKYIDMRRTRDATDPDARVAFKFWLDNKDDIERGGEVSNDSSYAKRLYADGMPLEVSALQAYYNRVADWGEKAVSTELDNDPPEDAGPVGSGLTAHDVLSKLSGFDKFCLPASTTYVTAAIDLGKYYCNWTVIAWMPGAGGCVVDYGIAQVVGTDQKQDNVSSEPMIYRTLLQWRDELLAKKYVDASGQERKVDFVFVDSGTFTSAAYEFCRQVKTIFHPSKGQVPFHTKTQSTRTLYAGTHVYSSYLKNESVWLYHLDTSYWKEWVHERFLTPTFDDNGMLRRGSLSLFNDNKHSNFAHQIVAEELVSEFKEGKGMSRYWFVRNDHNHWLDATYMACAAGEVLGVKLIGGSEVQVQANVKETKKPQQNKPTQQYGNFKRRPGGWVQGAKRR